MFVATVVYSRVLASVRDRGWLWVRRVIVTILKSRVKMAKQCWT